MDKARFFWEPVRAEDVPDYHDIIRNPMDFAQIEKKIDLFDYNTLDEFQVNIVYTILSTDV